MIIAIFGILDLIAGGILMLGGSIEWAGSEFLFYFMILFALKALYSIFAAIAAGFYFDVMGYLDLAASIFMLLLFWDIAFGFVFWIGLLILLKGIYSLIIGFISH